MEGNAEKQNKKRNDKKNKKIIFFKDNDSYLPYHMPPALDSAPDSALILRVSAAQIAKA